MDSQRSRGAIAFVVAIFLFALAAAPVSAAPWEPAPLAKAGDGLLTQIWDWLGGLFALDEAVPAPTETNEAGVCAPGMGSSRGCAIDPNG